MEILSLDMTLQLCCQFVDLLIQASTDLAALLRR
jgi:hypothetical protein